MAPGGLRVSPLTLGREPEEVVLRVPRAWVWQGAIMLAPRSEGSPGPTSRTRGPWPSPQAAEPFSMCVSTEGSRSRVWGHGKAGRLGSHRPVAESPGGHLAPISLGRQGALRGGPCGQLGAGMLGQAVCGMTQDP